MKQFIPSIIALILLIGSIDAIAARKSNQRVDTKDLDQLGGDAALIQMAQNIDGDNKARIVQKRAVDRDTRFEVGVSYGGVAGADPYITSKNLSLQLEFHLNPKFSFGLRYVDFANSLSNEGERAVNETKQAIARNTNFITAGMDFPLRSVIGTIAWYPVYGKTSWFESKVTQFDLYLLAGGGTIALNSGSKPVYTGGLGVGIWLTNYISARAEIRYQGYSDTIDTQEGPKNRSIHSAVGTVGLGLLL